MGASFAVGLVCLLGFACVCVWEQVQRYACTPGCVCDDVLGFVGLLWRGVVWCWGKVQCGVVVVWRGVVWCGVVWCGVVCCGVVWCGVLVFWRSVVWCGDQADTHSFIHARARACVCVLWGHAGTPTLLTGSCG